MSTCCLNKIDCARLLGCLGMELCLGDDRELGIKGEGRKGISAPPVNLKAAEALPEPKAFRRAPSPVALVWTSLGAAGAAPWAPVCCVGGCPVPGGGEPVPGCWGGGGMGAAGRLPPGGLTAAAVGVGHRRMAGISIALHFLCASDLWIAVACGPWLSPSPAGPRLALINQLVSSWPGKLRGLGSL